MAHDDVKVIKKWHVKGNGWSDIGYHFFIKKDGTLQVGRDIERVPAAQKGHNIGTITICVHGLEDFTEAQFATLRKLCAEINKAYNGEITFHGHNEVANKACPVFDYQTVLSLDFEGYIQKPENVVELKNKQEVNTMNETKSIWASKGVWGSIIAVISVITGALFGVTIEPETQALVLDQITAIITAGTALFGAIMGLYGRIKADKKIG